jgi:hypothetical protein
MSFCSRLFENKVRITLAIAAVAVLGSGPAVQGAERIVLAEYFGHQG